MSLSWLSSMVGGRAVRSARQKGAPHAQRELGAQIDADAVQVRRVLLRDLVLGPEPADQTERTVIARVDATARPAASAWLDDAEDASGPALDVRTDWLFFPATPEAVLMGVAEDPTSGAPRFRFNLRFDADRHRHHLQTLSETGRLGLATVPLRIGQDRRLESPCVFVTVPRAALREFLRELPAAPVV